MNLAESKEWSSTPDTNMKIRHEEGSLLPDLPPYRALLGSLIYLSITRLNISFVVGVISRHMQAPQKPHVEKTSTETRNLLLT